MRRPKIGYLSAADPSDRKAWSGSHFSIFHHLEKHMGPVVVLGPCYPRLPLFAGKVINQLSLKLLGKRYNYRHSAWLSKAYAKYFRRRIDVEQPDLLVAVSASCEIARLKTDVPVIYVCDAIVHSSINYYRALSNLTGTSARESLNTETMALQKSALVVFASSWAREAALLQVGHVIKRSIVLPFGPNFEPPRPEEIIAAPLMDTCLLLFVGVFWESKGGAIAVDCLKSLLAKTINARLVVCGCTPPPEFQHPRVEVIPFLNKAVPSENEKLRALFREAHFFILPTKFEAYGVVFCEASAYGLPSLAPGTGGVTEVIRDGINGVLLQPGDSGEVYAKKIAGLLADKQAYAALRASTRREFETRLNWDSWALGLKQELNDLMNG